MTKSQNDTFHFAIAHEEGVSDRARVDANSVFLVRAKCTSPEGWEQVTEGWIVVVVFGGNLLFGFQFLIALLLLSPIESPKWFA